MTAWPLLLFAASISSAESSSDAEAIHLVRAIGADQATLLGMRLSMERGVSEGKASPTQLACL